MRIYTQRGRYFDVGSSEILVFIIHRHFGHLDKSKTNILCYFCNKKYTIYNSLIRIGKESFGEGDLATNKNF